MTDHREAVEAARRLIPAFEVAKRNGWPYDQGYEQICRALVARSDRVEEARKEERERCAQVALSLANPMDRSSRLTARAIADELRWRGDLVSGSLRSAPITRCNLKDRIVMKEHADQWTLGQLLDALDAVHDKSNAVRFDFCSVVPTNLDSYRGYYEDLALGWKQQEGYPEPTVAMLLATLTAQLGTTVHGYKGGKYTVERRQPVYVANYGETGSTAIMGVDSGYFTVIRTICTEMHDG